MFVIRRQASRNLDESHSSAWISDYHGFLYIALLKYILYYFTQSQPLHYDL